MKKAGIALIVIGLLLSIISGFNYVTKKKVVDVGKVEITKDQNHHVNWTPAVGVGIMIVGGVILLAGGKTST